MREHLARAAALDDDALGPCAGEGLRSGPLRARDPDLAGVLLGAVLPVLGVIVIAAFNAFYWLPIRGESPPPQPS